MAFLLFITAFHHIFEIKGVGNWAIFISHKKTQILVSIWVFFIAACAAN